MADKSPRQHLSQKAGKSLKEKRAEKHAKADAKNSTGVIPPRQEALSRAATPAPTRPGGRPPRAQDVAAPRCRPPVRR